MKATRLFTLLALLLMMGGVSIQAQDTGFSKNQFICIMQSNDDSGIPFSSNPVFDNDDWLCYDNGIWQGNLSLAPEGIPFSWAVMFPSSLLQSYKGYSLTKVALYEDAECNFDNLVLSVYYGNNQQPLDLLVEQTVVTGYETGFHEITLEQSVGIDASQDLWICFTETITDIYAAAICMPEELDPNGRWVKIGENPWCDIANLGIEYGQWGEVQFMIRGYVTNDVSGVEEPLAYETTDVYPNPGGNTLNICTALQNARVEVYDINGRLVHSQALTENVTAIDATDWAEGVYVWKVIVDGKEAEVGKWIKE